MYAAEVLGAQSPDPGGGPRRASPAGGPGPPGEKPAQEPGVSGGVGSRPGQGGEEWDSLYKTAADRALNADSKLPDITSMFLKYVMIV